MSEARRRANDASARLVAEMVRLIVVVLCTVGVLEALEAGLLDLIDGVGSLEGDTTRLAAVLLAAATGYVLGGVAGRFSVHRMDAVERSLAGHSVGELLAGGLGGFAGLLLGGGFALPLLLLGAHVVTVPAALLVVLLVAGTGVRIGVARGGDLLRAVGANGRLPNATPTRGVRAKLVDTSTLVDGRILDVCRSGFVEGVLVIPEFVLYELQGLADAGDAERRRRGQRGLDVLTSLQRSAGVTLEVTHHDRPEISAVDAKLVAMARERGCPLLTVDANLQRVAEVQGVRVLNLHSLAETLRPPVLPGDRLQVSLTKGGTERGQGVGYLADGTMVVVEGGRAHVGRTVRAEVTSILSTSHGRMVFAAHLGAVDPGVTTPPTEDPRPESAAVAALR